MSRMTPAALASAVTAELAWLDAAIAQRLQAFFDPSAGAAPLPPPPSLTAGNVYAEALTAASAGPAERLVVALALAPWLRPGLLDPLLVTDPNTGCGFTAFGGIVGSGRPGFLPTRETALFLLAADLEQRLPLMALFEADAPLVRHELIAPGAAPFAPWQPLEPHPRFVARLLGRAG